MKKILLMLMILGSFYIGHINAAQVDVALQQTFSELAPGQTALALVYLTAQADIPALSQQLKAEHATLAERNRRVILALQDVASRTQPEVTSFLEDLKARGLVKNYKLFWIANMFQVEASEEGINVIAARQDVQDIYLDYPIEDIKPASKHSAEPVLTGHEIGLTKIDAPAAWAQGWTGAGRVVMNIDTGVDGTHPALSARFRGDVDGDGDVDESWFDPYTTHYLTPHDDGQHGTHTMGTICGRTESGDTIGVAIDAQWIAAAAIDRGGGIPQTIAFAIASFQWAVDPDNNPNTQDNPDAIGNSWGVTTAHGYPPCDATLWTVIDNAEAAGSVVIFSAGNEGPTGSTIRRPADRGTTPYNCFSVGAVDGRSSTLPIADFSSRGPSTCGPHGETVIKPEVVAPGVSVRSSLPGNQYANWDGTSMASPHITGSIAVIRQVNPNIDVETIKQILIETAHDLPASNPNGEDNTYGNGIIDLYQACLAAQIGYGFVEGYVRETNSDPIQGASIRLVGGFSHGVAGPDGHYIFGLRGDSAYTLQASFFGFNSAETSIYITSNDTTMQDFILQRTPSGSVHGRVVSMLDSVPIVGANVSVTGTPIVPVVTNDSGIYVIPAVPGDSTYTIQVRASGYGIGQDTVFVPTGGQAQKNFVLRPVESFENDNGGWSGNGCWEWGEPTSGPGSAYDGTKVWATVLGGNYPDNADDPLETGYYTINTSVASLTFYQWYDFENTYDGGNVSISVDGGLTWELLTPEGNYPSNNVTGLDNLPGYTGTGGDWQQAVFDVGSYQGIPAKFRFRFGSDGSIERAGWYIDAVVVNGATSWSQGTPDIDVTPHSFRTSLNAGDTTALPLSISNTGNGLLVFAMRGLTTLARQSAHSHIEDPIRQSADWGKHMRYENNGDFLKVTYDGQKIGNSSQDNPPMILNSGGPDNFGYTWFDSNEPNGPTYNWVDISSIGQPITLGDDQNQGPYDLGFQMPFYGNSFNSIRICSNGWISFTSTVNTYNNTTIPNSAEPNNLLALFWDDLNPTLGGNIYFYTNNVDSAIVSWVGIAHYGNTGNYTMEAIITAGGNIEYQYNSATGTLNSCTVGIENSTGSDGLQVTSNQDYLTSGLAIQFKLPIFWLRVLPASGYTLPGEASHAAVIFDARDIENGTYVGQILISSNDPDEATITLPCTLQVGGQGINDALGTLPASYGLSQNYPNPFNPTTQITFALPRSSEVSLDVYDIMGRQVQTLVSGKLDAGIHSVIWDGKDKAGKQVTSGIYLYRLKAGDYIDNRKMVLLK
jgi:hypothetical protein